MASFLLNLCKNEWQDAPKIWDLIRKDIDDNNSVGQFILTGSSTEAVNVHHTGTLRISQQNMYPMSLFEAGNPMVQFH